MSKFAVACIASILGLAASISRAEEKSLSAFRVRVLTPDGLVDLPLHEYRQFMELVPASANPSSGEIPEQELQKLKSASLQNFVKNKADGLLPEGADYYNDYYRSLHATNASKAAPTHGSGQPGTFAVVSDGTRQIRVNTKTGDSWLLVVDEQGSHWQEIKGLSKGGSQAIVDPQLDFQPDSLQPAASNGVTTLVDSFGDSPVPASMLSPSDVQHLQETYTAQLGTISALATRLENARDQAETVAATLNKQKEMLIKKLNEKGKEVAELQKKLKEAEQELKKPAN